MRRLLLTAALLLFSMQLLSAENAQNKRMWSVVISSPFKSEGDVSDQGYLQEVIPRAVTSYLEKHEGINVMLDESTASRASEENLKGALIDRGIKADFIITGTVLFGQDTTSVRLNIINTLLNRKQQLDTEPLKLSAVIDAPMSSMSSSINSVLDVFIKENLVELQPSPYRGFASFLSYFSAGIDAGRIIPRGDWSNIYNNSWIVSPYISINSSGLIPYTSFIAGMDYFSTDSEDKDGAEYSYLNQMHSYSPWGGVAFTLPAGPFRFSLTAGAGVSMTTFRYYDDTAEDGPVRVVSGEEISNNLYVKTSFSIGLSMGPVTLKAGAGYSIIFAQKSNMDALTFFGGVSTNCLSP